MEVRDQAFLGFHGVLLPRISEITSYWIEINRLLVPFGKHICTGHRPKCSTCPVLEFCRQVDVHRELVIRPHFKQMLGFRSVPFWRRIL